MNDRTGKENGRVIKNIYTLIIIYCIHGCHDQAKIRVGILEPGLKLNRISVVDPGTQWKGQNLFHNKYLLI